MIGDPAMRIAPAAPAVHGPDAAQLRRLWPSAPESRRALAGEQRFELAASARRIGRPSDRADRSPAGYRRAEIPSRRSPADRPRSAPWDRSGKRRHRGAGDALPTSCPTPRIHQVECDGFGTVREPDASCTSVCAVGRAVEHRTHQARREGRQRAHGPQRRAPLRAQGRPVGVGGEQALVFTSAASILRICWAGRRPRPRPKRTAALALRRAEILDCRARP